MNTSTVSLETQTPKSADGMAIGQSSSDLVGFWGATPVDQPASLTAQLTTLVLTANGEGTPDYTPATVITTGWGFASAQELITFMYVVKNLQTRCAEIEARLEEVGIVASN